LGIAVYPPDSSGLRPVPWKFGHLTFRRICRIKLADFIIVMSVLRREAETGWIIGEAQGFG
jgi:hypothetical protein